MFMAARMETSRLQTSSFLPAAIVPFLVLAQFSLPDHARNHAEHFGIENDIRLRAGIRSRGGRYRGLSRLWLI